MPRIAYRKLLPVVQVLLYLLLIWYGSPYRPTWQHRIQNWISPRPAESGSIYFGWIDGSLSPAEQLALGINAPVVITSMLVLIPFDSLFPDGAANTLAIYTLAAFGIPVMWYRIGRRLERRTHPVVRPSTNGIVLAVFGLAVSCLVALAIAGALAVRFREMLAGRLLILAWAVSGIVLSSKTIWCWRQRTPTT